MTASTPSKPSTAPNTIDAAASVSTRSAWRHGPAWAIFLGVTLLLLGGDLWIKSWAFANVAQEPVILTRQAITPEQHALFWQAHAHEPMEVIPGILSLHLTSNTGAVFGKGKGLQWLFALVSILAAGVILRVFWGSQAKAWVFHLALGLILAGALGNLYDRVVFGSVRDMLWLFPDHGIWPWIFNIADAALMVGVGLVLLTAWRQPQRIPSPTRAT